MSLVMGGGFNALAFSGIGIGIAENRMKGDLAWGRVLERRKAGGQRDTHTKKATCIDGGWYCKMGHSAGESCDV